MPSLASAWMYGVMTRSLPPLSMYSRVNASPFALRSAASRYVHPAAARRPRAFCRLPRKLFGGSVDGGCGTSRSEEHTSELQSRLHLVCRLLLEKKKKKKYHKV